MTDDPLPLGFAELATPYESGAQSARVFTEQWAGAHLFCPNCGDIPLGKHPNNSPVADLFCRTCGEDYELKAKKGRHGRSVPDGAYSTMCERLDSATNPNLALMNYDLARYRVTDLFFVPKQFFVKSIIRERPPLAPTARRAGWVGCNIMVGEVPEAGRIFLVRDGEPAPKALVLEQWKSTLFLKDQTGAARGWLIEVMKCVDALGTDRFTLSDVYDQEERLRQLYPNNNNVGRRSDSSSSLRDRGFAMGRGTRMRR